MSWEFLSRLSVEAMHAEQLHRHGGAHGLRDENALESALARAENKSNYGDPDIAELAGAYMFGLRQKPCLCRWKQAYGARCSPRLPRHQRLCADCRSRYTLHVCDERRRWRNRRDRRGSLLSAITSSRYEKRFKLNLLRPTAQSRDSTSRCSIDRRDFPLAIIQHETVANGFTEHRLRHG